MLHGHNAALAPAGIGATVIDLSPIGGSFGNRQTPLMASSTTDPTIPEYL